MATKGMRQARKELANMGYYRDRSGGDPRSALKAIRAKCVECSGGVLLEVKNCVIDDCVLYPFRMGKRPV